jgi:phosphatidylglycerophosphatase A
MNWLDIEIDGPNGGKLSHRECVRSQCGELAVSYIEAAVREITEAAFEANQRHYVSKEDHDRVVADRMLGMNLIQLVWEAVRDGNAEQAQKLIEDNTNIAEV